MSDHEDQPTRASRVTVEDILAGRLKPREDASDSAWTAWEHRTLNMHRGVLRWRPARATVPVEEIEQAVRERVRETFRIGFLRGFGFGALIELDTIPRDVDALEATTDTRRRIKGVWQWTVLVCRKEKLALGTHMWMEGYLTPVFRALLAHYAVLGFQTGAFKKEKDRFLAFLTGAARLKGFRLREFE